MNRVYQNSTEVSQLNGVSLYMGDVVDACLRGRLNLFLQGDTGSGKTQLAEDARGYFPSDKSMFILGRNDMDTRDLFQQINLEKLRTGQTTAEVKELTSKVDTNLIVVDELPNCVPAVRAQLFNLFDGFIEINGKAYPIGNGYSVGIATGNIGQQFTESSNDLGRALKDRMHVVVDVDYFHPKSFDTLGILSRNTNPRVEFGYGQNGDNVIVDKYNELSKREVPFEKLVVANYLIHGLDHCSRGSKRKMKEAWPTQLENHEQGSDVGLVLPVSTRGAKSIIRLSQAFDDITQERGAKSLDYLDSMMQAYRLVSSYSGVLNEADVQNKYGGDHYSAIDAVIDTTRQQFNSQSDNLAAGLEMVQKGKSNKKVLNLFQGRWGFMKDTLEGLLKKEGK